MIIFHLHLPTRFNSGSISKQPVKTGRHGTAKLVHDPLVGRPSSRNW
jgi:hypothetical protein